MGTTCTFQPRDEVEFLTRELSSPSSRVVYITRRGAHYWAVVENFGPDLPNPGFYDPDPDGKYRFGLWIKCSRHPGDHYGFCFKFVTESMGPAAYDAPKKIITLASPINQHDPSAEYALAWREKIATRKPPARSRFKTGDRIKLSTSLTFDTFSEDTFDVIPLRQRGRNIRYYRSVNHGHLCRVPAYALEAAEKVA